MRSMTSVIVAERPQSDVMIFLVLLLVVAVAPQQSLAQSDPPSSERSPLMCYYGPNQYLPCSSPPQGYDPLQVSIARYASVVARLRAYPRVSFNLPEPPTTGTAEELSQQAGALFVTVAYQLDHLVLDSNSLARRTKENESFLQTLYARERDLQARGEALPGALREANANLALELARAEAAERLVNSVEAVADRMYARADVAATESMQWLTVASPLGVPLVTEKMVAGRNRSKRYPLSVAIEAADLRASPRAIDARSESWPRERPAPIGTADDRIAATEALIPKIAALSAQYEERAHRYEKLEAVLKSVTPRVKLLETAVGGSEESLRAVERLASHARSRDATASFNRISAGANAAQAIGEAYIMETFRDKVVKPEVIRFLRANGVMQKIDSSLVAQLYAQRKSFLPPLAPEQRAALGRLIDVEKRAIRLMDDIETYLYAAIESISSPNDRNGAALAEEIGAGMNTAGREIIEKAAEDPGPLYKIAHAMFGRR